MKVRERVELRADFPDDSIEDDRDIIQFGGRNIAEALGEILQRLGCEVSPPEYAGDHGWEFVFHTGGLRLWCQVTDMDEEAILIFQDLSGGIRDGWFRPRRPNPVFADLLTRVNAALALDPRFSEVLWYPLSGSSKTPGAKEPVSEES